MAVTASKAKSKSKAKATTAARKEAIRKRRARQSDYTKRVTAAAQDIGKPPPVKNPERRKAATKSFRVFCETYAPEVFTLAWSNDHLKVIGKIERVIVHHDTFAVAMPRGSGKSALCRMAVVWGVLCQNHPFAILIPATAGLAVDEMEKIKSFLATNDLLLEDFPEVCYPIRNLDGENRRCGGQRSEGVRTDMRWAPDLIRLPNIAGSPVSGHIIKSASLEAHIRGRSVSLPDGRNVRPTLAVCDDPQTRESSESQGPQGQTTFRLRIINEDVQGLAGPEQQTAILVPCTVITPGDLADQLLNRKEYPDYRGERTRRVYEWPRNTGLWEEYRELRDRALQNDGESSLAMDYYRERMATCGMPLDVERPCDDCERVGVCMDAGARVDWDARRDDPRNLSSLQAAMHSLYKYKASGFAAEFQNDPLIGEEGDLRLTAQECMKRFNGRPQAEVPIACTELTMAIDVQQSSLWYVVVGWEPNFTGYVVDYGVWPRQARTIFTLSDVAASHNSLTTCYPGRGIEGTIQAGLEELIAASIQREFLRAGEMGLMRITRILVDAGKWPGVIEAVKRKVGGSTMLLCKGTSIRAGSKPMSTYRRKPGEKHGEHWYMPSTTGTREFPHVAIDVNYWKSFVHSALMTPQGDPGAMTLFGGGASMHSLFASHITAEYPTKTEGHGRKLEEWTIFPSRPDNHWFDAMVYASCAASVQGIRKPEAAPPGQVRGPRRVRVSIDEMLRRRNAAGAAT